VPVNRPRWVPLPDHAGWVPLEQVIADNLSTLFPRGLELEVPQMKTTIGAVALTAALATGAGGVAAVAAVPAGGAAASSNATLLSATVQA
jgi:hypothetical protein